MKYLLQITLILLSFSLFSQECVDCYENKQISTFPLDPQNCEMDIFANGRNNQFLNSFDWGRNDGSIFLGYHLNPNSPWQIPYSSAPSGYFMQSPFRQGFLDLNSNSLTTIPLIDYDFQWEDGWELMLMNTGYWPDGSPYEVPNPANMFGNTEQVVHRQVPYVILYNRYTGKMRFLFAVYTKFEDFTDVSLNIGYLNRGQASGIFRHGNSLDQPLDQETVTPSYNTHFTAPGNIDLWFMADAQLAYDPCVCEYNTTFDFRLEGITKSDLDLLARGISVQRPLYDSATDKPTYTNYLNINKADLATEANGALIYRTLDDMYDEYKNNLDVYQNQLNDYNSPSAILARSLFDLAKTATKTTFQSVVPAALYNQLGSTMAGVTGSFNNNGNFKKDSAKYSTQLSKITKGALANYSEQMFVSFTNKTEKPTKPSMPVASFSEMKILGTLEKTNDILLGNYPTPGNLKVNNGPIDPTRYPIYNKPVGLFALLETPELGAWKRSNRRIGSYPKTIPNVLTYTAFDFTTEVNTSFKLISPLKYKFNNNVDIDLDKTQLYGQYRIEISKNLQSYDNGALTTLEFLEENNLILLHDFKDRMVLQSDWYPIEILGEVIASLNILIEEKELRYYTSATLFPQIEKIQLSLMADIYFESLGSDGREINTTQVFTYELYNKEKEVDLIEEKGMWYSDKRDIQKFTPGTIKIQNEVIKPSSNFVWDVVGTEIHIKAENIKLLGNVSVEPGYTVVMEAFWDIEISPTTDLDRMQIAVKKDFYGFPDQPEVTDEELREFCGNNEKYKGNLIADKIIRQMEEKEKRDKLEEKAIEMELNLYPNPASDVLNLEISGISPENLSFQIFDLLGNLITSNTINSSLHAVDVSNLKKGVYLVEVIHRDQKEVKRFVKM